MVDFTEDKRRQYAAHLILERARDIPFLDITEGATEFFDLDEDEYLDEETAERIEGLMNKAIIRVSWPDGDVVFSDNFGDEEEG